VNNKSPLTTDKSITGTLIWYFYICPREVWLMAHEINPEEENPFLELGRLIHEESYPRERRGFETEGMKIDLLMKGGNRIIVGEVKKSSRFLKSSTMQLLFYLWHLKQNGIQASGELLIPKEKKRFEVQLSSSAEQELESACSNISTLIHNPIPPSPKFIPYCKNCAYREFCWS